MGSGHSHASADEHERASMSGLAARWMWGTVGVLVVAAVVAMAATWPSGDHRTSDELASDPVAATVQSVAVGPCSYDDDLSCRLATASVTEGTHAGEVFTLEQDAAAVGIRYDAGDDILVTVVATDGGNLFTFYDYQRSGSLVWLTVLFAAAVLLLGRWRGVGALAGLALSIVLLVVYVVPALLDGHDAIVVSLAAATLIAVVALLLAHGPDATTAVALVSSFAALAITGLLSYVFVRVAHLSGFADEDTQFLGALSVPVDPRGLLLAGMVIGALGVLDDVTVTQVSAVWELRRLQPDEQPYPLYRQALRIGRDHISSTVNTLFLAYAGASLSLFLVFAQAGRDLGSVVTSEVVATEVVRALVGSIGLISSVPIATWLAAMVLRRGDHRPPRLRYPKPAGRRPRPDPDWPE